MGTLVTVARSGQVDSELTAGGCSTPPPPQLLRWDKEVMWNLTPTTPSLSLCLLPESVLENGDQSGTGCHLAGAGGRVQVWHCTTVASSGDNGDDMSRDMLRVPVQCTQLRTCCWDHHHYPHHRTARIWVETAHEMVTRSSTHQTMQCLAYPEPGMWCSAMLQWYPAQQCSVTSALPSDRSHQVSNWKKGLAIKYVVIKEGHCYTLTNLPNYGTHTKCGSKLINPQKQSHNLCTIPTKGCLVFTLLYRAWRHTFKYIPNW